MIAVDPAFGRLIVRYAPIKRVATGFLWAEGPAWSGECIHLLFSDVQGDTQYCYIWQTGEIIAFRKPFDFQGRQHPCRFCRGEREFLDHAG